jgi:DnaJ domain
MSVVVEDRLIYLQAACKNPSTYVRLDAIIGPVSAVSEPDYYQVLQVSPEDDPRTIVAAYRRLARRYHPDVAADPGATQHMRLLNRAVEVLGDPQQRREYDRRRHQARAREAMAKSPPESLSEGRIREAPIGARPSAAPAEPATAARRNGSGGRTRPRRSRLALALVSWSITLGILAVIGIRVATNAGESPSPLLQQTAQAIPSVPSAPPSTTPAAAGASAAPSSTNSPFPYASAIFESRGTAWLVGDQMVPGVWRGYRGGQCSWKRLSSPEAQDDAVISTGSTLTVEIKTSDSAFWSEGCGWWTQVLDPPSASPTDPFGPGTWIVEAEVAPGLWQNSDSSEGCSWARLDSLDGGPDATTAGGSISSSRITIQIGTDDLAFHSWGCGTWTLIGD